MKTDLKKNIVIIGGSGMVGTHLSNKLKALNYKVSHYGRSSKPNSEFKTYTYNYKSKEIETEGIQQADYIINLAGANVGSGRWTKKRMQEIRDSRIEQTAFFHQEIKKIKPDLKAYISASAIGYYGMQTTDKLFTEEDDAGKDVLAIICKEWENKAKLFQADGIRTVIFRIAVVLSKQSGAISRLKAPAKLGLLSPLGKGSQYMPWIHIDDLCNLLIQAIENKNWKGIYNAVAPEHITNKSFTKKLLTQFNKKMWLPNVPGFALKLILGRQASLLLYASRVSSKKLSDSGFHFKFPNLEIALKNLLT